VVRGVQRGGGCGGEGGDVRVGGVVRRGGRRLGKVK